MAITSGLRSEADKRTDAAVTAIEQDLVDHIRAAYDTLIALGFDDAKAKRELTRTCEQGIAEIDEP